MIAYPLIWIGFCVFKYQKKEEVITATGEIDLIEFAMGEQIAALKKRCGSLHTGADDKSVTWTTFDLKLTAKLKKHCEKINKKANEKDREENVEKKSEDNNKEVIKEKSE